MPRWCDDHLAQKPPQWIKSIAFRDGRQLCEECLEKLTAHLRPPPLPISPPPAPQVKEPEPSAAPKPAPMMKRQPPPVIEEAKEKPVAGKLCKCGCGRTLAPGSPWEYIRGHKPKIGQPPVTAIEKKIEDTPIKKVIADLKAKRDKLSEAIEVLERL
jgi:hypothetical protein